MSSSPDSYTGFDGHRRLAAGPLAEVNLAAKRALERGARGPVLIFDDATGRSRDVDLRGVEQQARPRGRPKLGVTAREVTLLPRHWEWLAAQPGGASVALRKLVERARRDGSGQEERRLAHERAYHFMSAIAGDLPGFEEATRALFAHDAQRFAAHIQSWPRDVRDHATRLAGLSPRASS
ncbi:MAG TPA: DUF2239 family protein [Steroidobacteraceae bacterium]|jgi:hypothetical protein|nr:DUF2239 family protein [Steroidobacteraceae bacterium]